ncbi:MAG: ABC transporter ATP-binding protein [Gammaproteobacteria bacterium]|nr:ABC transporter ATP-binding protein [Gammaproteobacteria bacterium]
MTGDTPFLRVENVSKTFEGDGVQHPSIHVIDNVSMDVAAGEFVVYLGPSGCGKTTLMRTVGGLETASAGAIYLGGEKVTGPDRRKGMVFQAYTSFPWFTVLENIRYGTKYRDDIGNAEKEEVSRHYLELVGLKDFADYYVNRISGGMRQRVAIARTLAASPDILLMDEPFGALDAQTREFLQNQLLEINREERKTTIFVTHDVEEAVVLADRIFMFSARPATIIEEIKVAEHITGERDIASKETEAFFYLRNHVRDLMRREARRTEELAQRELMAPEAKST